MATTGLTSTDELMLQSLYWWDIATFFRCPIERDPSKCDIALVGVPHSTGNGTTERDQHLGPRAVRDVSAMARRVHMDFGIDPWDRARIRDMGDVPLPEANNNEACIERITQFYQLIDEAGARPVSVGGDHSVTGGIMQAISGKGASLTGGEKGGVPSLRRPYRCLRTGPALSGRGEIRSPLGELPRARRAYRCWPQRANWHARQPANSGLAQAKRRARLRGNHHGPLP